MIANNVPTDHEAEQVLLGSLILAGVDHPSIVADAMAMVNSDDFHDLRHVAIFDAMRVVYERDQSFDITSLRSHMRDVNTFKDIGGADYLIRLVESVATCINTLAHAARVIDLANKRRIIESCENTISRCSTLDKNTEIAQGLSDRLTPITASTQQGGVMRIGDIAMDLLNDMEGRGYGESGAIETGYRNLDLILGGGFRAGEMIVMAARPSMGKTALALNIAENMAGRGEAVLVFSIEMAERQLGIRIISNQSGIASSDIQQNTLTDEGKSHIASTVDRIQSMPLFIDGTARTNITMIKNRIKKAVEDHSVKVVFIDYMQIIPLSRDAQRKSRNEAIGGLSAELKNICREFELPLVVLSQLSRSDQDSATHPPTLDRLRDSGAIEQDADVVMMIHRPEYYDAEVRPCESDVIINKHRNGPTGKVTLGWVAANTRFEENINPFGKIGGDA